MDEQTLDQRILALLHDNSRLSADTIATLLGEEEERVRSAIKRLESAKAILSYSAVINWEKAGVERVTALIDVRVQPQRGAGFDHLAERIYKFPEVRSVFLMSGSYDLSVMVEGDSIKEVARFVSEKLSVLEYVNATTTHFILKKYKQDGVIFEDDEGDQRLVVTP